MTYILSMDVPDVIALLEKAIDKREEDKAWQMWLAQYPYMGKKFVPFSQFYKKITSNSVSNRPAAEILQEAERIRQRALSKKGQGSF